MADESFREWAILELMGHRRMAGEVSEQSIGGGMLLRIDVPATEEQAAFTQYYGTQAIYCLTPTTEDVARKVAEHSHMAPVNHYELSVPALASSRSYEDADDKWDG